MQIKNLKKKLALLGATAALALSSLTAGAAWEGFKFPVDPVINKGWGTTWESMWNYGGQSPVTTATFTVTVKGTYKGKDTDNMLKTLLEEKAANAKTAEEAKKYTDAAADATNTVLTLTSTDDDIQGQYYCFTVADIEKEMQKWAKKWGVSGTFAVVNTNGATGWTTYGAPTKPATVTMRKADEATLTVWCKNKTGWSQKVTITKNNKDWKWQQFTVFTDEDLQKALGADFKIVKGIGKYMAKLDNNGTSYYPGFATVEQMKSVNLRLSVVGFKWVADKTLPLGGKWEYAQDWVTVKHVYDAKDASDKEYQFTAADVNAAVAKSEVFGKAYTVDDGYKKTVKYSTKTAAAYAVGSVNVQKTFIDFKFHVTVKNSKGEKVGEFDIAKKALTGSKVTIKNAELFKEAKKIYTKFTRINSIKGATVTATKDLNEKSVECTITVW